LDGIVLASPSPEHALGVTVIWALLTGTITGAAAASPRTRHMTAWLEGTES